MTTPTSPDRIRLNVVRQPRGKAYDELVTTLGRKCPAFSLVYANPMSDLQVTFWDRLLPALEKSGEVTRWPGTRIWPRPDKGLPTLATYATAGLGVSVLSEARGLYEWQLPARPSDLAMYGPDGEWWLASVAHEHLAMLSIPEEEVAAITSIAGLQLEPMLDQE